jgi:acetolactate synthase-1/2/3 large subunit
VKTSDYISQFLEEQGVKNVFELTGGMITHMLDSFNQRGKIIPVSMHHEQGAAFAAEAIGRMTGIPGVALATSGPGATNLLTGIGSCYFDSSPAVFLTGQVNRHEQKGTSSVRQLGFQETDIVSMAKPITKGAWQARTPEEIPRLLEKAFALALEGRPGPVLLDIPMDIQRADITPPTRSTAAPSISKEEVDRAVLKELFARINASERPLILVGGGIRSGRATELFRALAARMNVPVVHSLMGVDVLPYSDPLRVGMIGSYGNRWANLALAKADSLIVLGSRLDVRQTGSEAKAFKGDKVIYHVDCDSSEVNNRVTGCISIVSSLVNFFEQAIASAKGQKFKSNSGWVTELQQLREHWSDEKELASAKGINPNRFMHQLSKVSHRAAGYVIDVGQHQMWAAQSLELTSEQRFLTSGGMGSMGFALPAAVGAAFGAHGKPVVLIAGDGGFQCNIQELQTVVRNQLPLKLVVINNNCHGMVRQFQESYFDSRYQSTMWGYSAPDFCKVAEAYGIPAFRVSDEAAMSSSLGSLWSDPTKPALLEVMVDSFTNVYPKLAFGHPITEMEPFAKPLEMEGT